MNNKIYGLVFRDINTNILNVAFFNDDKKNFTEIYSVDEDFNNLFDDIGFFKIAFVEIDMSNPDVAGFKYLLDFNFNASNMNGASSRDFIIDCYSKNNPNLISDVFCSCYKSVMLKDESADYVGGYQKYKLNS